MTPPSPSASAFDAALADELRRHVERLAGPDPTGIGERHVFRHHALYAARDHLTDALRQAGYVVHPQAYCAADRIVENIEVEIRGVELPDEIVVVGAHYDSRCGCAGPKSHRRVEGALGTPGANDNASGVAALLALARRFRPAPLPPGEGGQRDSVGRVKVFGAAGEASRLPAGAEPSPQPSPSEGRGGQSPARSLRFVLFVNEEPPFFQTDLMGSLVYARRCRQHGDHIVAALVLDTIGCFTDRPHSQRYPPPFGLFYPSTGNFLAFLSNWRSRHLMRRALASFRAAGTLPALGAALPTPLKRLGWSDDWAFWRCGYPAVCATDTAFLRYPHYHTPQDTPEKLDYHRMACAVEGLEQVVADLGAVR